MRMLLGVVVFGLFASSSGAEEVPQPTPKPVEFRRHWQAVRSDGTTAYDVTEVTVIGEDLDRTVYAVRDSRGTRWVLEYVMDYQRHAGTCEIRELRSNVFVRSSYKMSWPGKTKSDALSYFHANGSVNSNVSLSIETPQAKVTGLESEWANHEQSDDWRAELRSGLPVSFIDGLERMRETLMPHESGMKIFSAPLEEVTYGTACDTAPTPYTKRLDLEPDCGFDKDMGYACSDKQLQRVLKAAREGRHLPAY